MIKTSRMLAGAALFASVVAFPTAAGAETLVVDVSGAQGYGLFGDPLNTVRSYSIGAGSRVTALSYALSITAVDPSFLAEVSLAFTGSDTNGDGVLFAPGNADNRSGTSSYSGSADLTALGIDFAVGADGLLRLEFFETYDDPEVTPDSLWNSGTFTFSFDRVVPVPGPGPVVGAVPEPATWAMMIAGFGLAGTALRRRRKVTTRVSWAA